MDIGKLIKERGLQAHVLCYDRSIRTARDFILFTHDGEHFLPLKSWGAQLHRTLRAGGGIGASSSVRAASQMNVDIADVAATFSASSAFTSVLLPRIMLVARRIVVALAALHSIRIYHGHVSPITILIQPHHHKIKSKSRALPKIKTKMKSYFFSYCLFFLFFFFFFLFL